MLLSVIIVNYHSLHFTIHCLHSVMQAKAALLKTLQIETEIIVIDNHSLNEDISSLHQYFSNLHIIRNKENLGFSKANNIGLQQAKGDIVLFLNPDTLIQKDTLSFCIEKFLQSKKLGALGLRMIDGSGKFLPESKRGYPSLWASFTKMSNGYKINKKSTFLNSYYAPTIKEKENGKVKVLSGAFLMARKSIIDQIGGFDERYFMYGEDIDLSVQIEKLGYENWYYGEHSIVHYKGESTIKDKKYIQNFYGAMKLFIEKYHPIQSIFLGSFIDYLIKKKTNALDNVKQINEFKSQKNEVYFKFIKEINVKEEIDKSESVNQSTIFVWCFDDLEGIKPYIDFLESFVDNRKGIYIKAYPFIIETASSTQKSGFYEYKL